MSFYGFYDSFFTEKFIVCKLFKNSQINSTNLLNFGKYYVTIFA